MAYCIRCDNTGLLCVEAETPDGVRAARVLGACAECDAGDRVVLFLKAIAQGTPVLVRDSLEAGFKPTGVTYPNAVLEPAPADAFIQYPTEG